MFSILRLAGVARPPKRVRGALLGAAVALLMPSLASATPSTTYWAPSVGTCQAYLVPHITDDSYFGKKGDYPLDTGLTMGISPSSKVQAEIGYDLFMPTSNPVGFYLNGKICAVAKTFSIGAGVYNSGFRKNATNLHTSYVVAQKNLPVGGYVSFGGYYGLGPDALYTNEDGGVKKGGAIIGWASPDIKVNRKGLSKLLLIADWQTGKNALGGGGLGLDIYFNDYIGLITGPVFFQDKNLQPGGSSWLWTTQVDIDIPFGK